jgi:hypothetical protein
MQKAISWDTDTGFPKGGLSMELHLNFQGFFISTSGVSITNTFFRYGFVRFCPVWSGVVLSG